VLHGELSLREFGLPPWHGVARVSVGARPVAVREGEKPGVLQFDAPVRLREGETLTVRT
jgi:hypothetical protein